MKATIPSDPSHVGVPNELMQLNLQAHGQSILKKPFRQRSQLLRSEYRTEQHGTLLRESIPLDHVNCPIVIAAVADDKFHLIFLTDRLEIVPVHAVVHPTAGTFDIQNDACPGINRSDVDGSARFDQHLKAFLAQARNQLKRRRLGKRLPTRDFDQRTAVTV